MFEMSFSVVHKDRTKKLTGKLRIVGKKFLIMRCFGLWNSFVREEVEELTLKTRQGRALEHIL